MFGFRVLLFLVAYVVVIGEMVVGATAADPLDKALWIVPGGMVIALLVATSIFLLAQIAAPEGKELEPPSIFQWLALILISFALSAFSFYFPNYIRPILLGADALT